MRRGQNGRAERNRLALAQPFITQIGEQFIFLDCTAAIAAKLVADKLPFVPNRTSPLPMVFRILSGAICGAALCIAANRLILAGALLGGLGAANGAFGGFHVRRLLVKHFKIADLVIALVEDALAIGLGLFIVRSVAKRHRGRVWAESEGLGHGSTFVLQLPIAK